MKDMPMLFNEPKLYVAVVDDDADDCDFIDMALNRCDKSVEAKVFNKGPDLLEHLDQLCVRFGSHWDELAAHLPLCITLDLHMPNMNGKQVLEQLKAHAQLKAVPVVVLTDSRDEEDMQELQQLGADAYVVKPGSYPELLSKVAEIVKHWKEQRTLTKTA